MEGRSVRRIYLDHAATSLPKAPGVAEAMTRALELPSPGRGNTARAAESAALLARCRSAVNRLIGGASPDRIVFTAGGTDALNLALFGLLKPGDHAVVGDLEHTSVTRPLSALRGDGGITSMLECDEHGFYRPEDLDEFLSVPPTAGLVALSHGSNVAGTVQPVAELAAVCREHGVPFLLDACQTAGHVPIAVVEWGVDLLATGAHKGLLGPAGIGVLYVGERAEPLLRNTRLGGTGGGGGDAMPETLPHRLEPGTPNLPGVAGLLAAVEWIEREGVNALHARSIERTSRLIDRLAAFPDVRLLGTPDPGRRCGLVTVALLGWEPSEAAAVLDATFGVECRAGLHCAPGAHARFNTDRLGGGVRFSVGPFTTETEIDAAADAVAAILS
ncbi:Cysteine desulfurase SufS [Planctomycetes bacterium LzC2]|uniref:cysteine desulfurase n=2 Tax=Alienimonas chondri TaxID=2681879 RepID=A0ABX1VP58_9PLAN|nr:Cysteine desulfurase SufS [Alienimonas chondri]